MDARVQSHVVYKLNYHIVWIPKYRRKVLIPGVDRYFERVLRSYIVEQLPDVVLEKIGIQVDHVHILVVIPPKYAISQIVQKLKANTAKELRRKFEYLRRAESLWSIGYFVSSVGVDEARIRKYIEYQDKQDKGQAQLALD